jgi:hypothetical protein
MFVHHLKQNVGVMASTALTAHRYRILVLWEYLPSNYNPIQHHSLSYHRCVSVLRSFSAVSYLLVAILLYLHRISAGRSSLSSQLTGRLLPVQHQQSCGGLCKSSLTGQPSLRRTHLRTPSTWNKRASIGYFTGSIWPLSPRSIELHLAPELCHLGPETWSTDVTIRAHGD